MLKLLTLSLLSITVMSAHAEDVYSDQFHTLKGVELYEIVESEDGEVSEVLIHKSKISNALEATIEEISKAPSTAKNDKTDTLDKVNNVIATSKELVALGKEVYALIKQGMPQYTEKSDAIKILPRLNGSTAEIGAMNLQGWNEPVVKRYKFEFTNYIGVTPVTLEYMVIFTPGGNYNGIGKYITGAQIKPTRVDVKWGYSLDVTYQLQSVMNVGSHLSPVAGAVLMFDFHVKTLIQSTTQNQSYLIDGNGRVKLL